VKKTVNFDDPGTYHLYYGDDVGRPGTILTFFPWPGAMRGRHGIGQVITTSFAVPASSLGRWDERLRRGGVPAERGSAFDAELITFEDPDGLRLELVGLVDDGADDAILGFAHVTLAEQGFEATARLLTDVMGFRKTGEVDNRYRFSLGPGRATTIEVRCMPDAAPGRVSVGTVHHVAWRIAGDAEQLAWRARLAGAGLNVTPVLDRQYFKSIYFREPGGVLFEIATDPPGFTTDETPAQLGSALKLPPWLEPQRARIEQVLPRLG
jgi:glyoxalase family protein